MYSPVLSTIGFLLMVIIRLYYKFDKNNNICNNHLNNHLVKDSTGILNIINVLTGAASWKCNKHAFTTIAWLPLFYIEMHRGRFYTLLLAFQLITTSFAMPQLTFAYEGYNQDNIVKDK